MVSFKPWPLYPSKKSPCYTLHRRLDGPHRGSRRGGEAENSQPSAETGTLVHPARSPALYHRAIPDALRLT
jgi:hypothetical protein